MLNRRRINFNIAFYLLLWTRTLQRGFLFLLILFVWGNIFTIWSLNHLFLCKRAQSPPKMIFFLNICGNIADQLKHSFEKNCTIYMAVVLTRTTLKTETSLELHLRLVDTQLVLIYNHRTEKSFWTNILYSMITNFRVEFIVTHFKQTFYCKMSKLFLLKSSLNLSDYFT